MTLSMPATNTSFPRGFVPADADMGDWSQIAPLFDALDQRPIDNADQLERWLLDISELAACISEESTKRHVAMTCQTDDPVKEQAYLHFIEQIAPKCKPRWHRLRERYVASPARSQLRRPRYAVFDRSNVAAVEIFREANVPLQTEDEKLDQQYQKICGAMTVEYDGREQTLQQMARYQQEPDRAVRQRTWEMVVRRRLAEREKLDDIFDEMIRLRATIAANAGFENFRDYQFKTYERFDYTPADCFKFHEAIAAVAVPAQRIIHEERRRTLGVDRLRPWDLNVDPHNRPPLRPFEKSSELCEKSSAIFHRISPDLGRQFDQMVSAGWLDLDSRKGKAPGGYQATYDERRHPFIFMNAVGLHGDVETLVHEGGHAFHAIACRDDPLLQYRNYGMEMAEVASMGMELLAYDHLDQFYSGDNLTRARREQMESIVWVFTWIATIDAFQHWIYTDPSQVGDGTTADVPAAVRGQARTQQWLAILKRFDSGVVDWSGYEPAREAMWQRQLHLFGVPFYYIEYGIAQIGALQLWRNARADKVNALKQYREALALGGSRPLPDLWAAAGLKFDFSRQTLQPLIEAVVNELRSL